ncbi:MAG: CapA family protein [Alphaproteobacteria bacterium]
MPATATLALLGDLMLGGKVSRVLRDRPTEWIWGDVLPALRRVDAVLANLESPITTCDERWSGGWKMFHFRADPTAVDLLQDGNVRCVSLANNHILDFGHAGLADTVRHLGSAGIGHAGAGADSAAASAPAIIDLPGLKVGMIAATDQMQSFAATAASPGTNHIVVGTDSPALDAIAASVVALRRDGVGTVVLSLHWGPNMRLRPRQRFRDFARAAIDRGIDIVHGHSAHVFHTVEVHRNGIILYDTGNFIDDYWNFWNFGSFWSFPFLHDDWSFVFLVDTVDGRPYRLRLLPVRTRPWPLSLATGRTFEAITGRMVGLCKAIGTAVARTDEGLEIAIA